MCFVNIICLSLFSVVILPGALADFGDSYDPVCQPPERCSWHCNYHCGADLDKEVCRACIYLTIEGSHCTSQRLDSSNKIGKEMCTAY